MRMGKEAYVGWPSFNVALREGRTSFSIEGNVVPLTDLAIIDEDGDVGRDVAYRLGGAGAELFLEAKNEGAAGAIDEAVGDRAGEDLAAQPMAVDAFAEAFAQGIGEVVIQLGSEAGVLRQIRVQ